MCINITDIIIKYLVDIRPPNFMNPHVCVREILRAAINQKAEIHFEQHILYEAL